MFEAPSQTPQDPRADPDVRLPISLESAVRLQRRERKLATTSKLVLWMYTLFLLLVTAGFALVAGTVGEQR